MQVDKIVPQKVLLPTVQALVGGSRSDCIVPPQMPLQDVKRVISAAQAAESLLLAFTFSKACQPSRLPLYGPLGSKVTVQQWPPRRSAPSFLHLPCSSTEPELMPLSYWQAGPSQLVLASPHPPLLRSQGSPPAKDACAVQQLQLLLRLSFSLPLSRTGLDLTRCKSTFKSKVSLLKPVVT